MILLDSSAVIELSAGTDKGMRCKTLLEQDAAAVSSLVVHEVLLGTNEYNHDFFDNFFKSVHVLSFDYASAFKSVEIEKQLRKKGKLIGKLDILIASTSLVYDIPLVSCDNDYKNIEGLKLLSL